MTPASHCDVVLKEDRVFLVAGQQGDICANSVDGQGLWVGDTRFLSSYHVRVDRPTAGLDIDRERYLERGLHERVRLANRASSTAIVELQVIVDADFADMLGIRGAAKGLPAPRPALVVETESGFRLNEPEGPRWTDVVIEPRGSNHRVELAPGAQFEVTVHVFPGGQDGVSTRFEQGLRRSRTAYEGWKTECASFETDNDGLNALLERSRDDLRMLLDFYPTGIYPTGGVPWYAVPFGRDALITSLFTLPMNPEVARGTLRFLAAHQGRGIDAFREEEPGKILHEVRSGEAVERCLWPGIFFGTVDATPLFLCLLAETLDWTGDEELVDELWPAAEAALAWCQNFGDRDRDGYIEYGSGRGRNQGWKDADDSLTHVDGSDPVRPAALCEVQGYYFRALSTLARRRPELQVRADWLQRCFNRDFWVRSESFIAQALDADKRPVEAVSSNPGHCLWAGILSPAHARSVADRLVSPDLFSGWGIRTLSRRAINYDARNASNGGVFPFDTALAAEGLRRCGATEAAEQVASALLEAGTTCRDRRLPEFWSGAERTPGEPPEEMAASCQPQSWSAAAPFSLLTTLLGLEADAGRRRLRIHPLRTRLWNRLRVTGLHFAGQRIDFEVEGDRVHVGALPPDLTIDQVEDG